MAPLPASAWSSWRGNTPPMATGIDLLVPGLLGPMPGLGDMDASPQVPSLERALSRANVSDIAQKDYAATLFHLFGLGQNQSGDLPTAPYRRLGDGGQTNDRYWIQLSPVHLQPDGDGLLLFDSAHLGLSLEEAQQLTDLVRDHFSDRDWTLELFDPQRWYLGLDEQPDLQTSPLSDVIGRNINRYLPRGDHAMEWHVILNELQMLLHTSKVNMLREGRGQLPINGLWPHGGGSYHPLEQIDYTLVAGDDPLLQGMAQAAGIEATALPSDSSELKAEKQKCLAVYDQMLRPVLDADLHGWIGAAEGFNRWLETLLDAVRTKQLIYIDLYPCNGTLYRISASGLRRFWKRSKPLTSFISA